MPVRARASVRPGQRAEVVSSDVAQSCKRQRYVVGVYSVPSASTSAR
jgi:hypothetical protein